MTTSMLTKRMNSALESYLKPDELERLVDANEDEYKVIRRLAIERRQRDTDIRLMLWENRFGA